MSHLTRLITAWLRGHVLASELKVELRFRLALSIARCHRKISRA